MCRVERFLRKLQYSTFEVSSSRIHCTDSGGVQDVLEGRLVLVAMPGTRGIPVVRQMRPSPRSLLAIYVAEQALPGWAIWLKTAFNYHGTKSTLRPNSSITLAAPSLAALPPASTP